jgi:hypothetical protein
VSARYWRSVVSSAAWSSFAYHSGLAGREPPYPTLRYLRYARAYGHVVRSFLHGVTQVLGQSPGTARLDGGKGMGHRAVYGRLFWE